MPQKTNGHSTASVNGLNGSNGNGNSYDMEDGQTFLFTSESVGEGHPGKCKRIQIYINSYIHIHIYVYA